jgi:predicted glycogen debranching enzyme
VKELIRIMPWERKNVSQLEPLLAREWLVTNGLGGYAAGTVAGMVTRRYHGLLIAALPAPLGRMMMMPHLSEQISLSGGQKIRFDAEQRAGSPPAVYGAEYLVEFRLDFGLPVWRYDIHGIVLEKSVIMPHRQNTVYVIYRLLDGADRIRLNLLPSVHFRSHNASVSNHLTEEYRVAVSGTRHEISTGAGLPSLRMMLYGERPAFTSEPQTHSQIIYRAEEKLGYEFMGDLWSPGHFSVDLCRKKDTCLVASTESWETIEAIGPADIERSERQRRTRLLADSHPCTHTPLAAELVLAADQFIIHPAGRIEDAAKLGAAGDDVSSLIAGYHWFTDWGRDAMISLEGLTLVTGRHLEAGYILRMFAHHIRDGLIPNLFPEKEQNGLYNTADATLWYFHALSRYMAYTGDLITLKLLLPKLHEVVDYHIRGTSFGIGVDPSDGLLQQGAEGYQLTWMDAKVGDWVVTPRRGKAVEINALWYNALCLMRHWVEAEEGAAAAGPFAEYADRARESFNKRFWYAQGGYLYDVVDGPSGDDTSCRPNQIFSLSLEHPVLDRQYWEPVIHVVQEQLLTPFGLRSLSPRHPDYKPMYYGDLRARDAAYHQGTVWAWLIGPCIDAWLRLHLGDLPGARQLLKQFETHLNEQCLATISEIFDAEPPFTPRGCVAQAWSVAEVLRAWVKTAEADYLGGYPHHQIS